MQIKPLLVTTVLATLVGCADHSRDYVKQSDSVQPVVSTPDAKVKAGANYYIVPGNPDLKEGQAPSLVPPGSAAEKAAQANKKAVIDAAQWSQTKDGQQSLILAKPLDVAWKQVAKALGKTPYRVLDKDRSMGSYYVLDSSMTDNKITKATPIYRVYLKKHGAATQILLLDQHNHPAKADVVKRILGSLQRELV